MKKCYKAPESVVVNLDLESVIAAMSGGGDVSEGSGDAAQYRESYRSSLWND